MIIIITNPVEIDRNSIIDALYKDGKERKLIHYVNEDEINQLKENLSEYITSNKIGNEFGQILRELKVNKEKKNIIKIYYNSTIITKETFKEGKICLMCNKSIDEGFTCFGCHNSYHDIELIDFIKKFGTCPICKHSLFIES